LPEGVLEAGINHDLQASVGLPPTSWHPICLQTDGAVYSLQACSVEANTRTQLLAVSAICFLAPENATGKLTDATMPTDGRSSRHQPETSRGKR
jgi:hypothetical protein